MAAINADILRTKFGFKDPNVIEGILRDPGQVARYEREYEGIINPQPAIASGPSSTELFAKQKAEEEGFLTSLNERVAGQETLTSASERIGGELKLPELRESTANLMSTLRNVSGSFRDITPEQQIKAKQVGISAPNLLARIRAKQTEYQPTVETAQRGAEEGLARQQFGEQELGTRLGYLVAEQSKELEPFYKAQLPLLSDRLAREQTNYTQDKQNELSMILTKLSQGFQAKEKLSRLLPCLQPLNKTEKIY